MSQKPSLTVFGFLAVLLRRYRLVLGVPTLLALVAAVITLLLPVRYEATAQFRPEAQSPTQLPSGIAALAGQFGVNIGGLQGESSQFYADLLASRLLLERLLVAKFPAGPDSVTVLDQLRVKGRSPAVIMENAVKVLRKRTSVAVDRRTEVISISFGMPTAELAAQVSNAAVDLLNWYNRTTRQSQAQQRRQFAESRVADVSANLHAAEDSLRAFYDANHQWSTSPRLRFEEARLQRGVSLHQQVLQSLSQELETAKIAEVNDIPALTLVDPAVPPTKKSWPKRTLSVAATWVLAFMALVAWVSIGAYRDYFAEGDPAGVADLRASWQRVARPS